MKAETATKSDKYLLLEQINYAESVVNRNLDAPEVTRLVEGMDSYTGGSDEGEYTETCKLRIIATAAYLAGKQQADKDTIAILEAAKELGRVEVLEQMMAADKWDGGLYKQFSINSEGVHFSEIGPYSEKAIWAGYKSPVETLAYLDAHRKVMA